MTLKLLPCEVLLYLHKSTIWSCMEYCCHVWAGAPSCYLEILDKLQKWVCRTTLAHRWTVDSLSLFHRYYFGRCSYEWLNWLYFLILMESPLVILIDCMIFLSPFLDVIRISMLAVSGLVLLHQFVVTNGRPTCYSDRLHDFSVTIPRCYKNLYVSSFWAGVTSSICCY